MLRALFQEIVLIDSDRDLANAEAADIADAGALARPVQVRAGDYAEAATAGIAIITAGAATHGDESRLMVAGRSAKIVRSCVRSLMAAGFDGIILVAANPVDLMAAVALQESAFPPERVIGTGTLLDSNRLRQMLASRCHVAPAFVEAMILGEHGDSSFAALSLARIGGLPIDQFRSGETIDIAKMEKDVRQAAYKIVKGKGYTSFGIATAAVRICEAIVRDEQAILPVSTMLSGQYGVSDLYLSLPCILGAKGMERILEPALSEPEIVAFRRSADVVRAAAQGAAR
jgi:L-lactate dehydrogenase